MPILPIPKAPIMSKNKSKPNPISTFITTHIDHKKVIAYIDTGATLCFGKLTILINWEKLKIPVKNLKLLLQINLCTKYGG